MRYRYLFGPVSSRRLGRSLGVDLIPLKTCNYDCVYCECGKTTHATKVRQEFIPTEDVLSELSHFLSTSPALDFITFAGSGEPTLSRGIGRIVRFLKDRFPAYRIAILTNGSLLTDPAVRTELLPADVVLPTFSTAISETFQAMHRPITGTDPALVLDGLIRFRQEYRGEIWQEVFIIPGLNTTDRELAGLRDAIRVIHPDRVQLNTLDRPGTDDQVRPASPDELARIARVLGFAGTELVKSTCYEDFGSR
ncbi:radical SAM protein [Methanoregula sp.]|uniref:radical SAM protein n=1 Tax=Methanoregula sp. TaxID=2052170 RepID=UPI003568C784